MLLTSTTELEHHTVRNTHLPLHPSPDLLIPADSGGIHNFDISDDGEGPQIVNPTYRDDLRMHRLQQKMAALLRDIEYLKAGRDQLSARKAMYKSRLLERENHIRTLESQLQHATIHSW